MFVGAVMFGLFLVVSEILQCANSTKPSVTTPGYAYGASVNYVSDLGATCTEGSCYIPPSAHVFDPSIAFLEILTTVDAYSLQRA